MNATDYMPLTAGWIDYQVFQVKCFWHPATMHLDILSQTPSPVNGFQRVTRIPVGSLTAFVSGPGGVVCNNIVPHATLYNSVNGAGIGERINNNEDGAVQTPGILELQNDAVAGRQFNGISEIVWREPLTQIWQSFQYVWSNRVIAIGPWATWTDTVRSGLRETTGGAYNYCHARGIGAVDTWWAVPNADGSCDGYRMYATAWG